MTLSTVKLAFGARHRDQTARRRPTLPEIHGLDVYDPTTGQVRSSSVDDIAAWFHDTDYDGDAFFVRRAYFTGADDPHDKLRRALEANISDEAWASVNSAVSRPFPRPRAASSPSRSSTTTVVRWR